MSAPAKLGAFVAALAVLFGGGALAGAAIDPDRDEPRGGHAEAKASVAADGHAGAGVGSGSGGGHAEAAAQNGSGGGHAEAGAENGSGGGHGAAGAAAGGAHPVRGLSVAQDGLRLVLETPEVPRGRAATLRFRVAGEDGATVRDFDVEHEKRMHLILARRDLATFQHLHPEQGADGAWTVRLRVPDAGSHRVFADFSHDGDPVTLAADLRVDGPADLRPLPAPAARAAAGDGYEVRSAPGALRPGEEAHLRFPIARAGRPVDPEPYLGASGHLVALREGDLAFLHVHPTEDGGFAATFPTAGRYRLFLQFKHAGRVRTAAFTLEVG